MKFIQSKAIEKTDESAKKLIIEALEGNNTGGFDLDSIYLISGTYYILEFLKCDTIRPYNSHPKRYWHKNKTKFLSLWDITTKLNAQLYLINYEDSREQFKVIRVLDLNEKGITEEIIKKWDFNEFKEWFKALNSHNKDNSYLLEFTKETDNTISLINSSKTLPLYSIRAACGDFTGGREVGKIMDLPVENLKGNSENLFVVEAVGDSMLPLIGENNYCVFKREFTPNEGDIVLVEESAYTFENSGSYIIKKYTRNEGEINLISLNKNRQDANVTLTKENSNAYRFRGIFVGRIIKKQLVYKKDLPYQ